MVRIDGGRSCGQDDLIAVLNACGVSVVDELRILNACGAVLGSLILIESDGVAGGNESCGVNYIRCGHYCALNEPNAVVIIPAVKGSAFKIRIGGGINDFADCHCELLVFLTIGDEGYGVLVRNSFPCSNIGGGGHGIKIADFPIPTDELVALSDELIVSRSNDKVAECGGNGLLGGAVCECAFACAEYDVDDLGSGLTVEGDIRRLDNCAISKSNGHCAVGEPA
ncbi:unknown [Clostridium sp. CAG:413]|nr:unknown [Clostridium sp. CAG:413]